MANRHFLPPHSGGSGERSEPKGASSAIRLLTAAAVLAVCTGAAMASKTDTIPTSKGPLEIQAIHHASLMLTWNGKHILVDPAPANDAGDAAAEFKSLPKPDVIVYTHSHYDHFSAAILGVVAWPGAVIVAPQEVYDAVPLPLQVKVQMMKNGDKITAGGIPVEAVPMYNTTPERAKFHPERLGNGYILTLGGKRIYIAGDTEETPELAHLPNIDAAFLPMNLPYTETVDAAAKWVKDFKPRVVYPYHFRNADGTKSDLAAFKADVAGASDVRVLDWY